MVDVGGVTSSLGDIYVWSGTRHDSHLPELHPRPQQELQHEHPLEHRYQDQHQHELEPWWSWLWLWQRWWYDNGLFLWRQWVMGG